MRGISPLEVKVKSKKNKENVYKYNKNQKDIICHGKIKHHLPSKSTFPIQEQIHYNSPTLNTT